MRPFDAETIHGYPPLRTIIDLLLFLLLLLFHNHHLFLYQPLKSSSCSFVSSLFSFYIIFTLYLLFLIITHNYRPPLSPSPPPQSSPPLYQLLKSSSSCLVSWLFSFSLYFFTVYLLFLLLLPYHPTLLNLPSYQSLATSSLLRLFTYLQPVLLLLLQSHHLNLFTSPSQSSRLHSCHTSASAVCVKSGTSDSEGVAYTFSANSAAFFSLWWALTLCYPGQPHIRVPRWSGCPGYGSLYRPTTFTGQLWDGAFIFYRLFSITYFFLSFLCFYFFIYKRGATKLPHKVNVIAIRFFFFFFKRGTSRLPP